MENQHRMSVSNRVALFCGALTASVGVVAIFLWETGRCYYHSANDNWVPITCKTAFLFAVLGTAMAVGILKPANRRFQRFMAVASLIVVAMATITWIDDVTGVDIQRINLRDYHASYTVHMMLTGRMSPITSVLFIPCSLAVFLLSRKKRTLASILGTVTLLVGWVSMVGHLNGVTQIYGSIMLSMSRLTSATFVIIGVGTIAAAGIDTWPLNAFVGFSTRARLLRLLLPLVLFLMCTEDWIMNTFVRKPESQAVLVSTLIDLLALLIVCLAILQISHMIGRNIDRAQAALIESEEKYRVLFENAPEGILVADTETKTFIYANPAISRMLGYNEDELVHMGVNRIHPKEKVQQIIELFEAQVQDNKIVGKEIPCLRKDGSIFYADIQTKLITIRGRPRLLGFFADITNRKLAEEALWRSHRDLARLSRDREHLLEQERARISRHLHDEIGQQLTYLMLQLAHIEKRIQGVDASLVEDLKETSKQAQAMIVSVRAVAKSLRPIAIEHDGLIPSLRSSVEEFQRFSGVSCRLVIELGDAIVSESLATTVYRVVQEALTNIARHAKAHKCEVCLTVSDEQLKLTIRDDGIGADPEVLGGHSSLGIVGMKERATAVGGKLTVANRPKAGVLVNARFPLSPAISEDTD